MIADTFWTEDAIMRMHAMVGEGKSAGRIAAELAAEFRRPISRNAVIGKIARLAKADPRAAVLAAAPKSRLNASKSAPGAAVPAHKVSGSGDVARPRHGGGVGHAPAMSVIRAQRQAEEQARREAQAAEQAEWRAKAQEPGDPRRLTLAELDRKDCRFPLDGPTGEHQLFCALPNDGKSSYCAHHHHRCFSPRAKLDFFDGKKGGF